MLYAVMTRDKPDHLEVRLATRQAHIEYLKATGAVLAGPFLNDSGDMDGGLVVVDVEDRAAAEAWATEDPYTKADLFESVTIRAWKRVIG